MELRQLRYLVAIARAGTFAAAADQLTVAKSALSRQVRQLEAELGVALLVRAPGRREVRLTEAGKTFLASAVDAVHVVDEALERMHELKGLVRGCVSLVSTPGMEAIPGWSKWWVDFREAHPGVRLRLHEVGARNELLDLVATGETDVGVMAAERQPTRTDGVVVEELYREPVVLVLPPEHRFARQGNVGLERVRSESWLLPPRGVSIGREIVTRAANERGLDLAVDVECPSVSVMREMVLAGQGVAAVARSVADYFRPASVVELEGGQLSYGMMLAYRTGTSQGSAGRAFQQFVRERLEESAREPQYTPASFR